MSGFQLMNTPKASGLPPNVFEHRRNKRDALVFYRASVMRRGVRKTGPLRICPEQAALDAEVLGADLRRPERVMRAHELEVAICRAIELLDRGQVVDGREVLVQVMRQRYA